MDDAITHGFLTGVRIILTCAIISMALFMSGVGRNLSSVFNTKVSNITSNIEDSDLMQYDGKTVKGADVVTCIKHFSKDIDITINKYCGPRAESARVLSWSTSSLRGEFMNLPSYAYDDMTADGLSDGQLYINPNAEYVGMVYRNANGVITAITFNQVRYRQDAYEVPQPGNTTIVINNSNPDTSAALETAIAGLTTASAALNDAVVNLQETSSGASSVQAQTLAILQTMSSEVLPGMSAQIDSLGLATGVDSSLSEDITTIKGQVASLYEIVSKIDFSESDFTVDDVYDNSVITHTYLTQIVATTKDCRDMLSNLTTQVSNGFASLAAGQAAIQNTLAEIAKAQTEQQKTLNDISEEQANQKTTLSGIVSSLSSLSTRTSSASTNLERAKIAKEQAETIDNLQKQLNSQSANVETVGDLQNYYDSNVSKVEQAKQLSENAQALTDVMQSLFQSYAMLSGQSSTNPS